MVEDKQLIRQYAAERSETAFAELVRRHLKMVYAAALRQVNGDTHLAEDVTQTVFADLARKAKTLQHKASIAGWLFVSTRFAAANVVRGETRRRIREQEVMAMNEIDASGNEVWNKLRPLIDEALGELGETDRESIALRYFEGYEFALVGAALGVSENAARMRVDRALEKLRVVLQKRGLATTGAALGAALTEATGGGVPAQLAAVITKAALAQTVSAATPSILNLFAMNKLAVTVAGLAALAIAGLMVVHRPATPRGQNDVALAVPAAKDTPQQNAEVGAVLGTEEVTNAFKRAVDGHDAQVRARQAQEEADWFDKELQEFPGFKKFGAFARGSVRSGETLVTGGWLTQEGKRALVCVTASWIDPAGNFLAAPVIVTPEQLQLQASAIKDGIKWHPFATNPPQVTIDTKIVEADETVLDNLGMKSLYVPQNRSMVAEKFSDAQFQALINSIQQEGVLPCPRVTTEAGRGTHMAVQQEIMLDGQKMIIGPSIDVIPSLSSDSISVDLQVMVLDIETTPDAAYTAISPPGEAHVKPVVGGN